MTPEERKIDSILANATWGMSEQTEKDRKEHAKDQIYKAVMEVIGEDEKSEHIRRFILRLS